MNRSLQDRAEIAAAWPYTIRISKDETIDGQIVYLAMHPELPGCMAQDETVEEAIENLKEVTFEYILSLLEDRLPIPIPSGRLTKTTTSYSISNTVTGSKSFLDALSEAVQPCTRQEISTVELVR
jgi:predicted RNase H-like HicB family nuclease